MRRRVALAIGIVVVAFVAFMTLAPVEYSPILVVTTQGTECLPSRPCTSYLSASESFSCALVGIGAGYGRNWIWSGYRLSCPPSTLNGNAPVMKGT
jgi:hypothetical protein